MSEFALKSLFISANLKHIHISMKTLNACDECLPFRCSPSRAEINKSAWVHMLRRIMSSNILSKEFRCFSGDNNGAVGAYSVRVA